MATFSLNIIEGGFEATPKATTISAGLCTNSINQTEPVYFLSNDDSKFGFVKGLTENDGVSKLIITNITYYKEGLITNQIALDYNGTLIQNSIVSNIPFEIPLNDIADETAIPNLTFSVIGGNGINGESVNAVIYFKVIDNQGAESDVVYSNFAYTFEACPQLPEATISVINDVGPACGQVNYQVQATNNPISYAFDGTADGWQPGFGSPDFRSLYSIDYSTGIITGASCLNCAGDIEIIICNEAGCIRPMFPVNINVAGQIPPPYIRSETYIYLDLASGSEKFKTITYQMQADGADTFEYNVPSDLTYSIDANDPSIITLVAPGRVATFNIGMTASNEGGSDSKTLVFEVDGLKKFELQTTNTSNTICATYDPNGYEVMYHNGDNDYPDNTTTRIYQDVAAKLDFDGNGEYYNFRDVGSTVYVGETIRIAGSGTVLAIAECNA